MSRFEVSGDYPLHVHELVEGEAMPEMIERVAKAMYPRAWAENVVGLWQPSAQQLARRKARAAIEAMREMNEKMLHAAFVAMNDTPSGQWKRMKAEGLTPRRLFDVKMAPRWRAAIDAALEAK